MKVGENVILYRKPYKYELRSISQYEQTVKKSALLWLDELNENVGKKGTIISKSTKQETNSCFDRYRIDFNDGSKLFMYPDFVLMSEKIYMRKYKIKRLLNDCNKKEI